MFSFGSFLYPSPHHLVTLEISRKRFNFKLRCKSHDRRCEKDHLIIRYALHVKESHRKKVFDEALSADLSTRNKFRSITQ